MVKAYGPRAREQRMPVVDFIQTRLMAAAAPGSAGARLRQAESRLRQLEDAVGRDQPLPARDRRVEQHYDDSKPSLPVGFTSANWGSLASFGMTAKQTTKRIYGDRGNSFVAAVEFGPRLRAKSILAGGTERRSEASPHFADQAAMYSRGEFKDVLFYKEDIEKNLERGEQHAAVARYLVEIAARYRLCARHEQRVGKAERQDADDDQDVFHVASCRILKDASDISI
jgi:acyl-homoserine-lactone acylase